MRIALKTLIACTLIACAGSVRAQGPKLAYINLDEAFNGLDKTKVGHAKVEEAKSEFKEEIEAMESELEALLAEQESLAEDALNPALSEEVRAAKREEGEIKAVEIREFRSNKNKLFQERGRQLEQQILRMRQDIIDEIITKAKAHAADEGYSMVIDVSAQSLNQVPIFLYWDAKDDLTEMIVEELNSAEQ
jgi:Skp family chaperone for outer membrane proteins